MGGMGWVEWMWGEGRRGGREGEGEGERRISDSEGRGRPGAGQPGGSSRQNHGGGHDHFGS